MGGKLCERMTRCVIAALDQYPIPFAALLPPFLTLHVENALIALDAATVRAMRAKRRVLMVRFIAKALLNPFYRPEWASAPIHHALPAAQKAQVGKGGRERRGERDHTHTLSLSHSPLTSTLSRPPCLHSWCNRALVPWWPTRR
jgi:hypothetical protein